MSFLKTPPPYCRTKSNAPNRGSPTSRNPQTSKSAWRAAIAVEAPFEPRSCRFSPSGSCVGKPLACGWTKSCTKKPWQDDFLENGSKQWLPMVSQCRTSSIHSRASEADALDQRTPVLVCLRFSSRGDTGDGPFADSGKVWVRRISLCDGRSL